MLRAGGNAVDAVIAAAYVQSVVELPWGGIGGDAFVLVRTPMGEVLALNGSGAAPIKLGTRVNDGDTIARFGPLSVTVPGFVSALDLVHQRCGTMPLEQLLAAAIDYARSGFPLTAEFAGASRRVCTELDPDAPLRLMLEGNPGSTGSRFRLSTLADTLEAIADGGASAFYQRIGDGIATRLATRGGALIPDDFAAHRSSWVPVMSTQYRDVTVSTHPPVSMGCVLLHELALYERLGMPFREPTNPDRIDAMARCKHVAFGRTLAALRDARRRDPDAEQIAELQRTLLDPQQLDVLASQMMTRPVAELSRWAGAADGPDTTCVVAADRHGYTAAIIHSLFNEFGSRELDPDTGVLLNDRLANQVYAGDGNGGIAGGGRPSHTLNAVLVERDGRPIMMLATPGGRGQVQSTFQVVVNAIDGGLDPQQAIDARRWLSGAPRRPEPNDQLYLEPGASSELIADLEGRGHQALITDDASSDLFGSCVAVGQMGDGALYAAADRRREAHAATF